MTLLDRFPWLADRSHCRLSWSEPRLQLDRTGVWAIGNGYVFAHAGMALPLGRLQGIVGPNYQTPGDHAVEGAFGDCWVEIRMGNDVPGVERSRIWRPRGTAVLVSECRVAGADLRTVDFAPPGVPAIVRLVEWTGELGADVRIAVRFPRGSRLAGTDLLHSVHGPGRAAVVGVDRPAEWSNGRLEVAATAADSGWLGVTIATGADVDDARATLAAMGPLENHLERARAYWGGWLASTKQVETWPQRSSGPSGDAGHTSDLIESAKLTLKLQQSLPGGGAGPMVHFKGTWARDNNGVVRGLIAAGAMDEARAVIDYYWRASAVLGRIANRAPLDLGADPLPAPDWATVPAPRTEVPSWLVLQHWWWLRGGGDLDLVRDHWDYLVRCVSGQEVSDDGLLPFHGDETYLGGALLSAVPDRVPRAAGLIVTGPDDVRPWSLEATAAFAVANGAMARMAGAVGRGGEARDFASTAEETTRSIERRFWMGSKGFYAPALRGKDRRPHPVPLAPVNAAPLWLGYGDAGWETTEGDSLRTRARSNVETTLERLGFGHAAPGVPYDVGTTAGTWLWDLLSLDSPVAPAALAHVVRCASPAGEWAEVNGPGARPSFSYDEEHPNRLRPWEAGINLEAMLRYFRTRREEDEPELG